MDNSIIENQNGESEEPINETSLSENDMEFSQNENMLLSLKYNSKKDIFKSIFLGFLIGLAIIIPGVSGAGLAIIFGLYTQLIFSISNLFKKFKTCSLFLLPLVIGGIFGILVGFLVIKNLISIAPFAVISAFAGFMIGAYPSVIKPIKSEKKSWKMIVLFIFGAIIPVAFSLISILNKTQLQNFDNLKFYDYILFLVIGLVVSITQIVPGLSATALLMTIGYFSPLIDLINFNLLHNFSNLLIFICLGIGFVVGLLCFSKIISICFSKLKNQTLFLISGLSLGSIFTMFLNVEIVDYYSILFTKSKIIEIIIAIVLLIVSILLSYKLIKNQNEN